MVTLYPTIYRDQHGEEQIIIESTGTNLRAVIRGVEFMGEMFDDFEPYDLTFPNLIPFTLDEGVWLSNCSFQCDIPIALVIESVVQKAILRAHIKLELREAALMLELICGDMRLISTGKSGGFFENELFDIHRQLPQDSYMKICISCAFSHYHPAGNGMFGCLGCFRDQKHAIRKVKTNADLLRWWDTKTEYVQETHLCPEFEKRQR